MLRFALAVFAALVTTPALAGTICNFNLECYMTEECTGAGWELTVDREAQMLRSDSEDLSIVFEAEAEAGAQIVAQGAGSMALLTIGEAFSLYTTHIPGEPTTITYVGECYEE